MKSSAPRSSRALHLRPRAGPCSSARACWPGDRHASPSHPQERYPTVRRRLASRRSSSPRWCRCSPAWCCSCSRRWAMGSEQGNAKVTAAHLQRHAYLYIRQSTLRQVLENTESTHRQYALRDQALALGWAPEQIHVIDSDLGKSGAERDRTGFQQLVTEVSLDRVGIVLSLEVSRLARNSTDWHRLLALCALTETLILDEDGLYDPAPFNDRLVLGLKGTMSEAELHILRARLQGGSRNKARRGALWLRPPVGFVYDLTGRWVCDP